MLPSLILLSSIGLLSVGCTTRGGGYGGGGRGGVDDDDAADDDDDAADDDDDAAGVAVLGNGDHTLDGVDLSVVADNGLDVPRDLAFHPSRDELWVVNRGNESVTIIDDPSGDASAQNVRGAGGNHFLAQPAAIAFGDNGNFATIHETDELTQGQNGTPADFMGPTLWTSNRNVFDAGHAGHLDMLHNSPNGVGIAWEDDNSYWVFDGAHRSLTLYHFNGDHGPGGSDHTNGEVYRFAEREVRYEADVPSHIVYDRGSDLLYIADTGNGRVGVLDPSDAEQLGSVGPNYDGITMIGMSGTVDTVVDGDDYGFDQPSGLALADGVLYVGDNASSILFAFDLDGVLLDWVDLELGSGALMGIAVGPSGDLYVADANADEILRIGPLAD
jgi:hypothetical protein